MECSGLNGEKRIYRVEKFGVSSDDVIKIYKKNGDLRMVELLEYVKLSSLTEPELRGIEKSRYEAISYIISKMSTEQLALLEIPYWIYITEKKWYQFFPSYKKQPGMN